MLTLKHYEELVELLETHYVMEKLADKTDEMFIYRGPHSYFSIFKDVSHELILIKRNVLDNTIQVKLLPSTSDFRNKEQMQQISKIEKEMQSLARRKSLNYKNDYGDVKMIVRDEEDLETSTKIINEYLPIIFENI